MMNRTDMENKMTELNEGQMEAVRGGWSLLDLVGEGIEYLFDEMTEKIEDLFGAPQDGCTGKQTVPGFNVYDVY